MPSCFPETSGGFHEGDSILASKSASDEGRIHLAFLHSVSTLCRERNEGLITKEGEYCKRAPFLAVAL